MSEAPPTRIAVLTKEELNKYGYKAVTHPDGYVYFERTNELEPQILVKSEPNICQNFKIEPDEPTTDVDNFLPCGQANSDLYPITSTSQPIDFLHTKSETCTSSQDYRLIDTTPDSLVTVSPAEDWTASNTTATYDPLQFYSPFENLKLKHAEEIGNKGFSSCPLSTCNFISLSVAAMVRHSAKCNGVPTFHTNICTRCNCWLISSMQRDLHAVKCQGFKFHIESSTTSTRKRVSPSVTNKKVLKPKLKKKVASSSHLKKIDIIQPGLKRPVGSYLRKRSYTTLHFDIWTKKFKDDNYIPCHFKGCHFIALSVGDMCQHWAYCSGDSSFAKFKCHHCFGVVTSQSLLDIHLASSHSDGEVIGREEEYPCQDDEIAESLELLCDVPVPNKQLINKKKRKKVFLNQSTDHNYSSLAVIENLKRADELDLIEICETTFSLTPPTNKLKYASITTCPNFLLESPTSVEKKSVIVEVPEIVKYCELNIVRRNDKMDENISFNKLNNDQVQDMHDSNSTLLHENGATSPMSNMTFSRETVITDGRLINRVSCLNDKSSDLIIDGTHINDVLPDQNVHIDNLRISKLNSTGIVNSATDDVNMEIENNANDGSFIPEPVKKKRGRPKKVKSDLSMEVNDKDCSNNKNTNSKGDPCSSVSSLLNKKRGRRKISEEEEVDDLPRSARKRIAVARLQFSEDSETESSESEEENNSSSASEQSKNSTKIRISMQRKVGRRSKIVRKKINRLLSDDEPGSDCSIEMASIKKSEESGKDVQPAKRRGRPRKLGNIKASEDQEKKVKDSELNDDDEKSSEVTAERAVANTSLKRGRQPAYVPSKSDVKCGKCEIVVKGRFWEKHNAVSHAGLGWAEGEPPIDPRTLDSQSLLIKLRSAFKFCKYAVCELCGIEKKSFLGMHSHMTICGKTSEEVKEALMTCDVCGKQMQSYCMPSHIKKHEKTPDVLTENIPLPKRRSAIKAATCFQQVLAGEKKIWIYYQKGDPMPELNFQFKSTGKNKVPCMRENCNEVMTSCRYAMEHFIECPSVPDQYYQCLDCEFFNLTEEGMSEHCENIHGDEEVKEVVPEYDVSTESEVEVEQDVLNTKNKTQCDEVRVSKAEYLHKAQYIVREQLYSREGQLLYRKAVNEEMMRQSIKSNLDIYDTLYTRNSDWIKVEKAELKEYLPPLNTSLPVRHRYCSEVSQYQKLNMFESLSYDDFNVGFVGGAVQNLSWCPTSLERVGDANQYLAISVGSHLEKSPCVRSNNTTTTLLQIWDCGTLNENSNNLNSLHMVLGIAMDFGELWNLTWSPNDAWQDRDADGDILPRIGLVATACHDGAIRLYSISLPKYELTDGPPIYKVPPVVILRREDWSFNKEDACLRLSWGEEGVLCAGYRSGLVSVWRLHELACNHILKQDKTLILPNSYSFYAHHHPITDIALCPSNNRILATGGSDKRIKVWDLMNYMAPLRVDTGSSFQAFSWMNNWPALCYLVEDNVVGIDMPPQFTFCKSLLLKTGSSINDISFNNWAFITGIANTAGEFYMRQNIDPFIDSKKKPRLETVVSKVIITSITEVPNKSEYNSYADLENNGLGITFTDFNHHDSFKNADNSLEEPSPAKYAGNAIKKVAFNPNYRGFHHAALGVQCGFIRILRLKFLQKSFDQFITSHESK